MLCSRCSYIQFKSSPKCVNCGFDFRKQKSSNEVPVESGQIFTIFASSSAKAVAVSDAARSDLDFQAPASQEMVDANPTDTEPFDSPLELPETNFKDSGDFELDLSEMDNSGSEDWVMGATLTEDLAEISRFASQDSTENSERGPSESEVQGLGFETVGDHGHVETEGTHQEGNLVPKPELNVLDDEMAVQEIEPYAIKNETEFGLKENDSAHLKNENIDNPSPDPTEPAQNEGLELSESSTQDSDQSQGLELKVPMDDSGDISLETELELEKKDSKIDLDREDSEIGEISESSIDLKDVPFELDPALELKDLDLDLEIERPEVESPQKDASQIPGLVLEDQALAEDAGDKNKTLLPEDNSK